MSVGAGQSAHHMSRVHHEPLLRLTCSSPLHTTHSVSSTPPSMHRMPTCIGGRTRSMRARNAPSPAHYCRPAVQPLPHHARPPHQQQARRRRTATRTQPRIQCPGGRSSRTRHEVVELLRERVQHLAICKHARAEERDRRGAAWEKQPNVEPPNSTFLRFAVGGEGRSPQKSASDALQRQMV